MTARKVEFREVEYIRPQIVELSAVTAAIGGHCTTGDVFETDCLTGVNPWEFCDNGLGFQT